MKKIILIFFILSLFIPLTTYATSGACSSHGGVNCDAGSDCDGSVICNDGWRDSSVGYYDTDKCNARPSCTTKELDGLFTKYKVQEKIDELNEVKNQMIQLKSTYDASVAETEGSGITIGQARGELSRKQREYASKSTVLEAKAAIITDQYNLAQESIDRECESMGSENYKNQQRELKDLEFEKIRKRKR